MAAYYNEIEPYAAEWLRNLIKAGHIPHGEVDTRSIVDVAPDDLRGFTQCHFFAGIGGWGHALRLAGWPDDRPIWTGSCPCQPFSVAGKGAGTDDPRHLWPHFHRLITAVRPPVVMGEQVAGAAGYGWLDGVRADLAREGYASRGVDIPACSVDAPHIRQRLYWVAMDLANAGHMRRGNRPKSGEQELPPSSGLGSATVALVHPASEGLERHRQSGRIEESGVRQTGVVVSGEGCGFVHMADTDQGGQLDSINNGERATGMGSQKPSGDSCGDHMADSQSIGRKEWERQDGEQDARSGSQGRVDAAGTDKGNMADADHKRRDGINPLLRGNATEWTTGNLLEIAGRCENAPSFWSDHVWLTGSDGKARRSQSGLPLLAYGVSNRVGRLRAYGNAIVPPLAAEVVKALMETLDAT